MKNKTKKRVGIVAMMLVVIVAIAATAGTTLAKYISSVNISSQSATAAQWGYTISANTTSMFGDAYGEIIDTTSHAEVSGRNTVAVSATTGKNIVAPGTKGKMSLTVNGTAEVNAVLTLNLGNVFETVRLFDEAGTDYYPINWYVGGVAVKEDYDHKTAVTAADFATAIKTAVEKAVEGNENVKVATEGNSVIVFLPANTQLKGLDLSISWDWDFETLKDVEGDYNIEDTLIGLLSYSRQTAEVTYNNLPDNVKEWLWNNKAKTEYDAYTAAQAAVASAEADVTAAQLAVSVAQKAFDEQQAAVTNAEAVAAEAQKVYNAANEAVTAAQAKVTEIENEHAEDGDEQYKESEEYLAAKAELATAQAALEYAQENLTHYNALLENNKETLNSKKTELENKQQTLATAKTALETKQGELTTAETNLKTKAEAAYKAFKNSITTISFNLQASVEQTQLVAETFAAKYGI